MHTDVHTRTIQRLYIFNVDFLPSVYSFRLQLAGDSASLHVIQAGSCGRFAPKQPRGRSYYTHAGPGEAHVATPILTCEQIHWQRFMNIGEAGVGRKACDLGELWQENRVR